MSQLYFDGIMTKTLSKDSRRWTGHKPAQLPKRLAAMWTNGIRYPAGAETLSAVWVRLLSGCLDLVNSGVKRLHSSSAEVKNS